MTKTAMVAHLVAVPELTDEVEEILRGLVASTTDEAGTEIYVLNRDANQTNSFWFFELYADDDALATHGGSAAMADAMVALDGKLAEAPMLTIVAPMAAKGIDL
jgi:quinol monooxygenase YgiN